MKNKLMSSALVIAALAPSSLALPDQKRGPAKQSAPKPAPGQESKEAARKKIEERVKEAILEQLNVDPAKVTPDARIVEDLGADSLDITELVMRLEESFSIEIECEDTEGLLRVGNVYDYVEKRVRQSKEKVR